MLKQSFSSAKELAEYLGISRTTLYKRANKNDITLTGTYTESEIDKLYGHSSEQSGHSSEQSEHETGHSSEQSEHSSEQSEHETGHSSEQSEHSSEQSGHSSEQSEHETGHSSEQINELMAILFNQIQEKDIQLKDANNTIKSIQKLADQSQQLQLDLQQKLTQHSSEVEQLKLENKIIQEELAQEKAKSFWQKLFHK